MDEKTAGRNVKTSWIRIAVFFIFVICLGGVFCLAYRLAGNGKTAEEDIASRTGFALNTSITIRIYHPDENADEYLKQCFAICDKYEKICSRTNEDSELFLINKQAKEGKTEFTVSDELKNIISYGLDYGERSGGAFDITIEPVSAKWDFTADVHTVPDRSDIEDSLSYVSYRDAALKGNTLTFARAGMGLDLGGIAKGYIADKIKEYLLENKVESALIYLGGNVLCVGEKPDGSDFRIGIQMPFGEYQETIAAISCKDCSIVTSGIYERYFVEDDTIYHHILNPKTGYPYENDLLGVTILSKKSVDGDGLSTACFSLGVEEGKKLVESLEDTYAVFITKDKKLHYSEGFEDFILKD